MAPEEQRPARREALPGASDDSGLGAAGVGDEGRRLGQAGNGRQLLNDPADGMGQVDEVRLRDGLIQREAFIDDARLDGMGQGLRRADA